MDVLMAAATVVSALAALGALWFARDTVRETRALRREDRLVRLPELIADLGAIGMRITRGATIERHTTYPIARSRLSAAIHSSGEELPACTQFLLYDLDSGKLTFEEIQAGMSFAIQELSVHMHPRPLVKQAGGAPHEAGR